MSKIAIFPLKLFITINNCGNEREVMSKNGPKQTKTEDNAHLFD